MLNFRFNIREDLWRNDVFVIYTDDDWQISEKPSCESTDIVNSTDNYFVATDNTHRLQCVSDTEANMLFIYGLAVDIDVSELGSENNSLDI